MDSKVSFGAKNGIVSFAWNSYRIGKGYSLMPSDGFTLTIEKNNLPGLDKRTRKETTKAVNASAGRAVENMKAKVPVKTERLKKSIKQVEPEAGDSVPRGAIATAITADARAGKNEDGAHYGMFVEFGSAHGTEENGYTIAAQPFFVPGVEAERQAYESGIINAVNKAAEGKGK